MTKPIVQELNVQTQELTVREMNDAEYAQHLIDAANAEERAAAVAAKAAAKQQALAALGLSQEVINLLAE
jgi:hypothetical protein